MSTFASAPSATPKMLIPIAPQCAGKTTALTNLGSVKDISIDDQSGVYLPIPFLSFLDPSSSQSTPLSNTTVRGKSIRQRLFDDRETFEQRLILSRLTRSISETQFLNSIYTSLHFEQSEASPFQGMSYPSKEHLITSVESSLSATLLAGSPTAWNSETVDLYIREALWPDSITAAKEQLLTESTSLAAENSESNGKFKHDVVSWGNTNARYSDYIAALEAARASNRAVFFMKYRCKTGAAGSATPELDINVPGGLQELIQRNVERFINTGRYVPCNAIEITERRCLDMLVEAENEAESGGMGGFEVDRNLCAKVGWEMKEDRTVERII